VDKITQAILSPLRYPTRIERFQDAMVDALCQPVFTNSDSSVQVISKSDKQQAIGSIRVKKQSSSMNKSIMEAMEKGNRMFVDFLDKICISNLGIEKKCDKFQEAVNDKQIQIHYNI
jgi:hypothetical protein